MIFKFTAILYNLKDQSMFHNNFFTVDHMYRNFTIYSLNMLRFYAVILLTVQWMDVFVYSAIYFLSMINDIELICLIKVNKKYDDN